MSKKNGRQGGGKRNQPGGREGNLLAKTNKSANSNSFDAHLGCPDQLRRHGDKQRITHTAKVRRANGLPAEKPDIDPIPNEEETSVRTLVDDDDDRKLLLIDDLRLIIGLRIYGLDSNGCPVGQSVKSDQFVAKHRQVRRDREIYRELDGTLVRVGDVIGIRKGRQMETLTSTMQPRDDKRRAPGVIKSIMVRLMPHEAEIAGSELNGKTLDAAMDRVVNYFAEATGCEIISAVVHRMSGKDLHIHIQYTMIIGGIESKWMLGRRLAPWKRAAAEMARAALMKEVAVKPNPSAIGARKRRLIANGELDPAPVAGVEYRKNKGRRSLRDDAILGYSMRMKLNLVRIAEDAGDWGLGNRVINRNDERKRFRPIASREDADLEQQYLDLWLERTWRNSVTSLLPAETLDRIRATGLAAANDYADFGTVMVEETHLKRRKLELAKMAYEIELAAQHVAHENELLQRAVEDGELTKREYYEAAIRDLEVELQEARETAHNDRTAAEERVSELEDQWAEFESKEAEMRKSAATALAVGDLAKREAELAIHRAEETALRLVEQAELEAEKATMEKEAAEAAGQAKELELHYTLDAVRGEMKAAEARITELESSVGEALNTSAKEKEQFEQRLKHARKTTRDETERADQAVEDLRKNIESTGRILEMFQKVLDVPGIAKLLTTKVWNTLQPFCNDVGLKVEVLNPDRNKPGDSGPSGYGNP